MPSVLRLDARKLRVAQVKGASIRPPSIKAGGRGRIGARGRRFQLETRGCEPRRAAANPAGNRAIARRVPSHSDSGSCAFLSLLRLPGSRASSESSVPAHPPSTSLPTQGRRGGAPSWPLASASLPRKPEGPAYSCKPRHGRRAEKLGRLRAGPGRDPVAMAAFGWAGPAPGWESGTCSEPFRNLLRVMDRIHQGLAPSHSGTCSESFGLQACSESFGHSS